LKCAAAAENLQGIFREPISERRYQVFISSACLDRKSERLEVVKALLELDCFPAAWNYFPSN